MKKAQLKRSSKGTWDFIGNKQVLKEPLILVFGDRKVLEANPVCKELKEIYPKGHIVMGSACGQVSNNALEENNPIATAIEFEKSTFLIKTSNILDFEEDSYKAGKELMEQFPKEGLKHVIIISEGSFVNGSSLTEGIESENTEKALVTGGMCGDADRFEKTLVSYNQEAKEGEIVAVGLYGESLEVSFSSSGGWTRFGPQRIVTKSKGNVLYELDGKPALDLYKMYLGDKSKELPSSALLYPLDVLTSEEEQSIVRSVLGVDEAEKSIILAGDIKEQSKVHLMMSNVDNLAYASEKAIELANMGRTQKAEMVLFVSCIGRKLVLDQRVEEEMENVKNGVEKDTVLCGFYSYGEIVPFNGESKCKLHNQTITLTLLSE